MVGLDWKKLCLHVHTPASKDYKGDKNISPREFLEQAMSAGIDVIGITDHHSFSWIDSLRQANQEILEGTGKNLIIFPGIEIHTSDSVHVLCLFDPDIENEDLDWFMGKLGLPSQNIGDHTYQTEYSLEREDLFNWVSKKNGIIIFAHVKNRTKGLLEACRSHAIKDKILRSKKYIFECSRNQYNQVLGDYNQGPVIITSDIHGVGEFLEEKLTWVKLGSNPNIDSLRQIILDPELRVSINSPKKFLHCRLIELNINTEYFDFDSLHFNPELNILIGGRGTGKSLIVELLTYITGKYPLNDTNIFDNYINKLNTKINEGSNLSLTFEVNGKRYRVSREFNKFWQPERTWKGANILENFSAYDERTSFNIEEYERDRWVTRGELNWKELLWIDIFTQACVVELAKIDINDILKFIDNFSNSRKRFKKLRKEQEKKREFIKKIERIEEEIVSSYTKLKSSDSLTNDLNELKHEIEELQSRLETEEYIKSILWSQQDEQIKIFLKNIDENLKNLKEPVSFGSLDVIEDFTDFSFEEINTIIDEINSNINTMTTLNKTVQEQIKELKQLINHQWQQAYSNFQTRLRNLGGESEEINLRAIIEAKQRKCSQVENEIKENDRLINQIQNLEKEHNELTKYIQWISIVINIIRTRICRYIEGKIKSTRIELEYDNQNEEYYNILSKLVKGQRNKDEFINLLLEDFNHDEIFHVFTSSSLPSPIQVILDQMNLSEAKINVILAYSSYDWIHPQLMMVENPLLLKLKRLYLDYKLKITFKKHDEWKSIRALSPGERCSVILSILLTNEREVLVIDQPEDELDYISKKDLIDLLRKIKRNRQLIFVTHYQNIPVLADAENIIKLDEIDLKCVIERQGCFEELIPTILLMEGGPEAFKLRYQKYEKALNK